MLFLCSFQGESWEEVYREVQVAFDIVSNWLNTNKPTLNTYKTKFMTFMTKKNIAELDNNFIITHSRHRTALSVLVLSQGSP